MKNHSRKERYVYSWNVIPYPDSIIALLVRHKEEILTKIKDKEKQNMMHEMYLMIQKLNIKFTENY